ncbi:MAG: hypothetical protein IJ309_02055 [Clostridia bacterium]|nr:hypothetical protein [Clostridia bacterium]
MSGPKSYDYSPSYPTTTTHSFQTESRQEGAEIAKLLSRFGSGVSVSVSSSGSIDFVVSSTSGVSYSQLKRAVDNATFQYKENQRLAALLAEKKTEAIKEASKQKARIKADSEAKATDIKASLAELKSVVGKSREIFTCVFGTFGMDADNKKIEKKISQLEKALASLREEETRCLRSCDDRLARLQASENLDQFASAQRRYSVKNIEAYTEAAEIRTYINDVSGKYEHLRKFYDFLLRTEAKVKSSGLDAYISRLAEQINTIDIFDSSASGQITSMLKDIEAEVTALKAQSDIARAKSQAVDKVDAQIALLKELEGILTPMLQDTIQIENQRLSSTKLNTELAERCREILDRVKALEEVGDTQRLRQLNAEVTRCSSSLSSPGTTPRLNGLVNQLSAFEESAIKYNELYKRFKEELDRYNSYYEELNTIVSDGGNASGDKVKGSVLTIEQVNEFSISEQGLNLLCEATEQLKSVLGLCKQSINASALLSCIDIDELESQNISKAAGRKDPYQQFKQERKGENIELSFLSSKYKGVMFEASFENNGAFTISPKSVVLSNGTTMLSKEQLKEFHESCQWSKELEERYKAIGFPYFSHTEIEGEAREEFYKSQCFYRIESDSDSIRYLKLLGFSVKECVNQGYGLDKVVGSGAYSSREIEEYKKLSGGSTGGGGATVVAAQELKAQGGN